MLTRFQVRDCCGRHGLADFVQSPCVRGPFAKGARRKCYYDPVAAGAALVGGLRLGCPRLGRSTIRLRCVRVCGPGAAAHLCPAVQRSQAFCFEGLGSVKATGTGCPLPGRSSIFMPFCNLVAVSGDF